MKIDSLLFSQGLRIHGVIPFEQGIQLLGIDRSTAWRWEKDGKIVVRGIGSKRYFTYSDVLQAMGVENDEEKEAAEGKAA